MILGQKQPLLASQGSRVGGQRETHVASRNLDFQIHSFLLEV